MSDPSPSSDLDQAAPLDADADPPTPGEGDRTGLATHAAPGTSEELPVAQGIHVPHLPETDPRT